MPEQKTDAEAAASAEEIKDVDATQGGPRGNVHSEEEDGPALPDVPPMPN